MTPVITDKTSWTDQGNNYRLSYCQRRPDEHRIPINLAGNGKNKWKESYHWRLLQGMDKRNRQLESIGILLKQMEKAKKEKNI